MTTEIKAFLTVLGATIIGNVTSETDSFYDLENALFLNARQDTNSGSIAIDFAPISVFADGDASKGVDFTLFKNHVVMPHAVKPEIEKSFNEITGVIQLASSGDLAAVKSLSDKIKK